MIVPTIATEISSTVQDREFWHRCSSLVGLFVRGRRFRKIFKMAVSAALNTKPPLNSSSIPRGAHKPEAIFPLLRQY
jgi:hypothetical protein